ncbi:hypothetical protein DAKH74_047190 [Maudiozyma humilis]|uniref:Calcineurin-like phosphoesterase domain-containing protein n=1 Tax=Maudiozyma humilis TaxID=51915 RepID=A0AAV5S3L9_MAUHU|nr:hypothetical protein DAKH74_047190 [Kazachstania humilis]
MQLPVSVLLPLLVRFAAASVLPTDIDALANEANILQTYETKSDEQIISSVIGQLNHTLGTSNNCTACVTRLSIGKTLVETRPDLVAPAFTKWCIDSGFYNNDTCQQNFGISTIEHSEGGANFADMLSYMDPLGYDGQLFCYYKEGSHCKKPATPNVTVSNMWPPKSPEHMAAPEPGNNGTFKVLHISDLHIDMDYTVGNEANCTDPICCTPRSHNKHKLNGTSPYMGYWNSFFDSYYNDDFSFEQGTEVNPFNNSNVWTPATSFGNYMCDPPERLINSSLNNVIDYAKQQNFTFDFTIFTGDMVDHDWTKEISLEDTIKSEESVLRDIKSRLGSTPVYPVLGNHDSYPYGQLAPEGFSFSNKFTWNTELISDIMQDYDWVSNEEAQQARAHYTGYAVETKMGLKVISLNSNTWYRKNDYAYMNASNPDNFGMFKFLIDELVASEAKNQRVWITAHIPPAAAGLPVPSNVFAEIVERFSPSTIAGVFFGHTHQDQFEVLYAGSGNDTKTIEDVINHAWIAPSITPWGGINPAWRYYEVDSTTFSVMNMHTFYMKLNDTYTNNGAEPQWQHEYAARDVYNVSWPATSPLNGTFWHLVAEQVGQSVDVRQTYENYSNRFSPYTPVCKSTKGCDEDYCFLTSFTLDGYDQCMAALPK